MKGVFSSIFWNGFCGRVEGGQVYRIRRQIFFSNAWIESLIFLTCLRFHGKNSITIGKSCEISKYTFQKALLFCSCCSIIIGLLFFRLGNALIFFCSSFFSQRKKERNWAHGIVFTFFHHITHYHVGLRLGIHFWGALHYC